MKRSPDSDEKNSPSLSSITIKLPSLPLSTIASTLT